MEVINGPVAIISTIVMFGVLGVIKYILVKKKKLRENGKHDDKLLDDLTNPYHPMSPLHHKDDHPG